MLLRSVARPVRAQPDVTTKAGTLKAEERLRHQRPGTAPVSLGGTSASHEGAGSFPAKPSD